MVMSFDSLNIRQNLLRVKSNFTTEISILFKCNHNYVYLVSGCCYQMTFYQKIISYAAEFY